VNKVASPQARVRRTAGLRSGSAVAPSGTTRPSAGFPAALRLLDLAGRTQTRLPNRGASLSSVPTAPARCLRSKR
jgi:hypothetical protein